MFGDALGHPRLAENGLLVRSRRQLPRAGGRRSHFRIDVHIDNARATIANRLRDDVAEIVTARNGDSIGAARACPRREVGVVALPSWPLLALVDRGAELTASEHAVLDIANGGPSEVVPNHPDARQA